MIFSQPINPVKPFSLVNLYRCTPHKNQRFSNAAISIFLLNTDLGNQQLNIEERCPKCTGDGCSQNDDHPRNRIIIAVGIKGVGIPIDLLSPLCWKELQCPSIHNEEDIEQGKNKAEK